MKKYKYYILSFTAMFCLSACSSLLNEDPLYTQNNNVVFQSESNAELALLGCYGYLSANAAYGQLWQEVPTVASGLTWAQRNGADDGTMSELAILPANGLVSSAWKGMYKIISETNAFLESIDKSSLSENVKIQKGGEAKFIRAIAYYNLVSLFGDVPLKTIASTSDGLSAERTPVASVLQQVVKDLQDATAISATSSRGRLNSWSAKAFLGKVYFKMATLDIDASANLQKAKDMFDAVYASNAFSLESKFGNLFGNYTNSKEAIIQINFSSTSAVDCYNRGSNRFAPASSTAGIAWGTYRVTKFAYDLHQGTYPGDPRIEATFLTKWRTRSGNNQANPKAQVGTSLCANDSTYTYPYWTYASSTAIVPGTASTKLQLVAKLPYADFTDAKNPTISVLQNYATAHGSSPYNDQVVQSAVNFTKVGNSNKWPFYAKMYDQNQSGTMSHKNLIVYRYSEMLLLMADVYNELGDTKKAISLANEVLARARKSSAVASTQPADWSISLTKDQVKEKLYFERIIELCGEPDIFDMVRIRGTVYSKKLLELNINHELTTLGDLNYDTSTNAYVDYSFNNGTLADDFLKKNLLLPIPSSEIDANPALTNNDNNFGY